MLRIATSLYTALSAFGAALARRVAAGLAFLRGGPERAQTTAEYALVLLGAAGVALLLVAWATRTDAIGRLLDGVVSELLKRL
jgi:hypothetical protein